MTKLLTDPISWFFLLSIAAMICWRRSRRWALLLSGSGTCLLWLFASPWFAYPLLHDFSAQAANNKVLPLTQVRLLHRQQNPQLAILVISAGRVSLNPAFGEIDTVNGDSLSLLAYASWLHKRTELPVMLAGQTSDNATSEAVLMNQAMLSYFNIAPKWIADARQTSDGGVPAAANRLRAANIQQVILVAHAAVLNTVQQQLESAGLQVIPAAAVFVNRPEKPGIQWLLPASDVLQWSQQVLHRRFRQNLTASP